MPKGVDVLRHCGLVGAQLDRADMRHMKLAGTDFSNASLRGVDMSFADLRGCKFVKADLSRACFYMADFTGSDLSSADMTMSYGKGTLFTDCKMWHVQMRRVTYKNCFFINADLTGADFAGGFFVGTAFDGAIYPNARNIEGEHGAIFRWYMNPKGGPISYSPLPGYKEVMTSVTGTLSFQENAARRRMCP